MGGPALIKGPTSWPSNIKPSAFGWLMYQEPPNHLPIIRPRLPLKMYSWGATRTKGPCTKHVACFCSLRLIAIAAAPGDPSRHTGYKLPPLQSVALHHAANLFFLPVPTVPSPLTASCLSFPLRSRPLSSPLWQVGRACWGLQRRWSAAKRLP